MSQQHIEIAVRQRAVIHDLQGPGHPMTSRYLDRIRSTRYTIEELILVRQVELAKTTAAAQRRRVERDLAFLRDELARIDAKAAAGGSRCASCNSRRIAQR
jgi:hypothetical protein